MGLAGPEVEAAALPPQEVEDGFLGALAQEVLELLAVDPLVLNQDLPHRAPTPRLDHGCLPRLVVDDGGANQRVADRVVGPRRREVDLAVVEIDHAGGLALQVECARLLRERQQLEDVGDGEGVEASLERHGGS